MLASKAGMLPGRIGGLLTTVRVTREGADIAQTAGLDAVVAATPARAA